MRVVLLAKPSAILAFLGILLLSFSSLFGTASASQYYDSSQALSFNGAGSPYLYFSKAFTLTDPVCFGNGSIVIAGSTWFVSTVDLTLTAYFESNWLNYTVSSVGTQWISNGTAPYSVYLDGVSKGEGSGWTLSGTTIVVSAAGSSASILWGRTGGNPPPTLPPYIPPFLPPFQPPNNTAVNETSVPTGQETGFQFPALSFAEFVVVMVVLVVGISAYQRSPLKRSRKAWSKNLRASRKMKVGWSRKKKVKTEWKKEEPWE